jgi:hypothetical protein
VSRIAVVRPQFVELLPPVVESGLLYVSPTFASVIHLCCCGCGLRVVTPLSPADWQITYDGRDISLYPSIGNWSFPCRSHYWIHAGNVVWARQWTEREISAARRATERGRRWYFDGHRTQQSSNSSATCPAEFEQEASVPGPALWWNRLARRLLGARGRDEGGG